MPPLSSTPTGQRRRSGRKDAPSGAPSSPRSSRRARRNGPGRRRRQLHTEPARGSVPPSYASACPCAVLRHPLVGCTVARHVTLRQVIVQASRSGSRERGGVRTHAFSSRLRRADPGVHIKGASRRKIGGRSSRPAPCRTARRRRAVQCRGSRRPHADTPERTSLSIAVRTRDTLLQLLSHVPVVVDLAVERDVEPTGLVRHRLMPARREIDHGQPAVPQSHPAVIGAPDPGIIGPAVSDGVAGDRERAPIANGAARGKPDYSAHGGVTRVSRPRRSGPRWSRRRERRRSG